MKPVSHWPVACPGQLVNDMIRNTSSLRLLEKDALDREDGAQLNIAPSGTGSLWKVVVPGIRCPECNSDQTKSRTGKRLNSQGFLEHYRLCMECKIRFRVIFE